MAFDFGIFEDDGIEESFVEWLVEQQWYDIYGHFNKMWEYYQNNTKAKFTDDGRKYVQSQELGLPSRITGFSGDNKIADIERKEVVVENDIAWRINAFVDFLFGKKISFMSQSRNVEKRTELEKILNSVFDANGGVGFFQDMAVLGGVYGFVDCLIRPGETFLQKANTNNSNANLDTILKYTSDIGLELIEATRALPILDENDYKKIKYYVQYFNQDKNSVQRQGNFLTRLLNTSNGTAGRERVMVCEIIGADAWQRYEGMEVVGEGINLLGKVPVVHIQNIAQPYCYEGISDVEPLIPLQDELNTRLSDRASRVTFQSFKMYLAKGIEGFEDRPVSPGRMWSTDNAEASIEQFGGDGAVPSENMHISEIREAIDKTSMVTPLIAGVLKSRLGNLTSAVALNLTMMGMLAKIERKRFTYGAGLKQIAKMIFELLDAAGIYATDEQDREFEVIFPDPLPEDTSEKLKDAKIKLELGIDKNQILKELGYEYIG